MEKRVYAFNVEVENWGLIGSSRWDDGYAVCVCVYVCVCVCRYGMMASSVLGFMGVFFLGAYVADRRSASKLARARQAAAINTLSDVDAASIKHVLGYIPPWVSFPDMMRVTWLNVMLEKLWPFVDKATALKMKESVEPMMNDDEHRPSSVKSISFTSFTLGTLAPKLRGVKVYASEQQSKELVVEVDIAWGGNQNIALKFIPAGAAGYLFAAEVGIAHLTVSGRLRITLKPLIAELPCFGALEISLVSRPDIDFDLKVLGGDLLSIPGLGTWIHSFVEEVLADLLVYPKKLTVPMVDNLDGMNPCGLFIVKAVEAKNLPRADLFSYSDPYVRLTMSDPPFHHFQDETYRKEVRTKTVFNTLSPVWDQVFSLVVHDPKEQHVAVHVYDYDTGVGHDLLGTCKLQLKDLKPGQLYDDWITLRLPERFRRRHARRHARLKHAGLTERNSPQEAQIRLKYCFNFFSKQTSTGEDQEEEAARIRRLATKNAADGEAFAGESHGLLTVKVTKVKISLKDTSRWLTYVPVVGAVTAMFEKVYYQTVVRIVQISKYREEEGTSPAPEASWQPTPGLYTRSMTLSREEVDDSDRIAPDTGTEAPWTPNMTSPHHHPRQISEDDSRPFDDDGAMDEMEIEKNEEDADGALPNLRGLFRSVSSSINLDIGLAESRIIKKKDVLFKSKTSGKMTESGDIVYDESFEYVLSENQYDETRQVTMNKAPMEVVIQFLLKLKDGFGLRTETVGVVNVPLTDLLASKHIERQFNVVGARGNTTITASLNWQSF